MHETQDPEVASADITLGKHVIRRALEGDGCTGAMAERRGFFNSLKFENPRAYTLFPIPKILIFVPADACFFFFRCATGLISTGAD